ncbi:uncharacterized protein BDV14DRAFT_205750 [Aspergillus stella-maris]|uniref:uncharacterized protein n=1 Tax=Aspergillus stella-maris TaxID=1810926 RepID=UPI003CCDD147
MHIPAEFRLENSEPHHTICSSCHLSEEDRKQLLLVLLYVIGVFGICVFMALLLARLVPEPILIRRYRWRQPRPGPRYPRQTSGTRTTMSPPVPKSCPKEDLKAQPLIVPERFEVQYCTFPVYTDKEGCPDKGDFLPRDSSPDTFVSCEGRSSGSVSSGDDTVV